MGALATGCHCTCPATQGPHCPRALPGTQRGRGSRSLPTLRPASAKGAWGQQEKSVPPQSDGGKAVRGEHIPKPRSWGCCEICPRATPLAEDPCSASGGGMDWTSRNAARATISQRRGQSRDTSAAPLPRPGDAQLIPGPASGASSCREPAGLGHRHPSLPASANSQAEIPDVPMEL